MRLWLQLGKSVLPEMLIKNYCVINPNAQTTRGRNHSIWTITWWARLKSWHHTVWNGKGRTVCISRSSCQKTRISWFVDCSYQCRGAQQWFNILSIYERPAQGWCRPGPQGFGRNGICGRWKFHKIDWCCKTIYCRGIKITLGGGLLFCNNKAVNYLMALFN